MRHQRVIKRLREEFMRMLVCVVDVKLTSPTLWRRPSVRWLPRILLISAHSAFFCFTSEFFSVCGRLGNSQRPASKPVSMHTHTKKIKLNVLVHDT